MPRSRHRREQLRSVRQPVPGWPRVHSWKLRAAASRLRRDAMPGRFRLRSDDEAVLERLLLGRRLQGARFDVPERRLQMLDGVRDLRECLRSDCLLLPLGERRRSIAGLRRHRRVRARPLALWPERSVPKPARQRDLRVRSRDHSFGRPVRSRRVRVRQRRVSSASDVLDEQPRASRLPVRRRHLRRRTHLRARLHLVGDLHRSLLGLLPVSRLFLRNLSSPWRGCRRPSLRIELRLRERHALRGEAWFVDRLLRDGLQHERRVRKRAELRAVVGREGVRERERHCLRSAQAGLRHRLLPRAWLDDALRADGLPPGGLGLSVGERLCRRSRVPRSNGGRDDGHLPQAVRSLGAQLPVGSHLPAHRLGRGDVRLTRTSARLRLRCRHELRRPS